MTESKGFISLIDAGPGTGKTYCLTNGYLILSEAVFGKIPATDEQEQIFEYPCVIRFGRNSFALDMKIPANTNSIATSWN